MGRMAAASGIGHISERGNPRTIARMYSRLDHQHSAVRCAALYALGQVAKHGDKRTMGTVMKCLKDKHYQVKIMAAKVLTSLAEGCDGCDKGALSAIVACWGEHKHLPGPEHRELCTKLCAA